MHEEKGYEILRDSVEANIRREMEDKNELWKEEILKQIEEKLKQHKKMTLQTTILGNVSRLSYEIINMFKMCGNSLKKSQISF
jgi:hypothetical protein